MDRAGGRGGVLVVFHLCGGGWAGLDWAGSGNVMCSSIICPSLDAEKTGKLL